MTVVPAGGADDAADLVADRHRHLPPALAPGADPALLPHARVLGEALLRRRRHRRERVVDQVRRVAEDRELGAVVEQVPHSGHPLQQAERLLVPGHPVGRARAAHLVQVLEVPVVGRAQRLGVREPRLPAEQLPGTLDRDEGVLVGRLVVPLGQWRQPRDLESAQRQLGGRDRDRLQPSSRSRRGRSAPAGRRARSRTRRRRRSGPSHPPGRRTPGRRRRRDPRRRGAGRGCHRRRGSGCGGRRGSSRTGSRRRRAARGR